LKVGIGGAIGLLVMATSCQLVVDVADYRFGDRDAGRGDAGASELEPPPTPAPLGEHRPDGAPPERPSAIDAGSNAISEGPTAELPEAPSEEVAETPAEEVPEAPAEEVPEPAPDPPPVLPPDPVNGCSIIEYCYAHQVQDTTDEERCIQRGCSLDEAIVECRLEIADTCGIAPQPPFVMITLSGERRVLD
jgi:hypothetical protein